MALHRDRVSCIAGASAENSIYVLRYTPIRESYKFTTCTYLCLRLTATETPCILAANNTCMIHEQNREKKIKKNEEEKTSVIFVLLYCCYFCFCCCFYENCGIILPMIFYAWVEHSRVRLLNMIHEIVMQKSTKKILQNNLPRLDIICTQQNCFYIFCEWTTKNLLVPKEIHLCEAVLYSANYTVELCDLKILHCTRQWPELTHAHYNNFLHELIWNNMRFLKCNNNKSQRNSSIINFEMC